MSDVRTRRDSLPRLALTRRGRRGLVALVGALVPLVVATVPVHAELDSVYALPWAICSNGTCTAETTVHLLLPADYAACVATLTAAQFLPNTAPNVAGAPPGSAAVDACDSLSSEDASLTAWAQWTPGGCVSNGSTQAIENGRFPIWNSSVGGSTTSTSCSTIDSAFTQAFSLVDCPGTTFQVTSEIKGFANGTYQSNYQVTGSGTCATAFDVLVVEGAEEQGLGNFIGCKVLCPGPPAIDTGAAAAQPARLAVPGGVQTPSTSIAVSRPSAGGIAPTACRRTVACPN